MSAYTFLTAGAAALAFVPALVLAQRGIIPIGRAWFHGAIFLLSLVGFLASLVFLVVTRKGAPRFDDPSLPRRLGEGGAIRVLAWLTLAVTGTSIGFVVFVVVSMMLYYDGQY